MKIRGPNKKIYRFLCKIPHFYPPLGGLLVWNTQRRFGCLKKLFNFLRGQKRGRGKSPEKGVISENNPNKINSFSQ